MAEVDLEKNLALGIGPPGPKFLLPNMWREFLTFTLGEKYGVAWVAKANNKFNIKPDASIRHYKMYNTEEEALNARLEARARGEDDSQFYNFKVGYKFAHGGGRVKLWKNGRVMTEEEVEKMLLATRPPACSRDCPLWAPETAAAAVEVNVEEFGPDNNKENNEDALKE